MQKSQIPKQNSETETVRYHGTIRTDVLPLIPKTDGWLIDIGGGIGATALAAKAQGIAPKVAVLDQVDEENTMPGLDYYRKTDISSFESLQACANDLNGFDTVLALDVLEHLIDPWETVSYIHTLMNPGALFIASIPNVREYRASLPLFFGDKWTYKENGILDKTHLRFFVKSTAVELMVSSGLTLKSVVPSSYQGRKHKLFRALSLGLLNSFTHRQYIITVEKTE